MYVNVVFGMSCFYSSVSTVLFSFFFLFFLYSNGLVSFAGQLCVITVVSLTLFSLESRFVYILGTCQRLSFRVRKLSSEFKLIIRQVPLFGCKSSAQVWPSFVWCARSDFPLFMPVLAHPG